mgnify:CR=1 FL=1
MAEATTLARTFILYFQKNQEKIQKRQKISNYLRMQKFGLFSGFYEKFWNSEIQLAIIFVSFWRYSPKGKTIYPEKIQQVWQINLSLKKNQNFLAAFAR